MKDKWSRNEEQSESWGEEMEIERAVKTTASHGAGTQTTRSSD